MKKAVPVRMPDWPEQEFPTTQQVGVYLLFWERQRKHLVPDPGAGFLQTRGNTHARLLKTGRKSNSCYVILCPGHLRDEPEQSQHSREFSLYSDAWASFPLCCRPSSNDAFVPPDVDTGDRKHH